eukprot:13990410-Ditylum_brightwellii.AAC.1
MSEMFANIRELGAYINDLLLTTYGSLQSVSSPVKGSDVAQSMGQHAIPTQAFTYIGILCPMPGKCKCKPVGEHKHELFPQSNKY